MSEFEGFDNPKQNWSRIPHQLIDALPIITSEAEMKVILYVLRHTWGFGDQRKTISIDEFCNGRKRRDGNRFDSGVGLSENAVKDGLKRAIEHGFLTIEIDKRDLGRIHKTYALKSQTGSEVDPPQGQKLTPPGSEVDPRSEKETIERKKNGRAKKPRARNRLFDVLVEVTHSDPKSAGGYIAKTAADLKAHDPEFILKAYSPGGWWYTEHCRGMEIIPTPSLSGIARTIKLANENGNGHSRTSIKVR